MSIAVEESTGLVLGLDLAGTRMTPEEFDAVEEWDEDYRYELIDGILVVTPVPSGEESGPNHLLGHLLYDYQTRHAEGSILDVSLTEQYVFLANKRRRADHLIWTNLGRMPDRRRDLPTIAVEFVSSGRRNRLRDYVEKRGEYLALGIAEYWIIDRFRRTLTACRRDGDDVVVKEGETYRTPLLPGFELPLAPILANADSWVQSG